jgi:hypothetical protein
MKVVKDYPVVRAELQKRGLWEKFAETSMPIRMVVGDLEVFYEQRGSQKPAVDFIAWFRFEARERDRYENLVRELARRSPDGSAELVKFLQRKTGEQSPSLQIVPGFGKTWLPGLLNQRQAHRQP